MAKNKELEEIINHIHLAFRESERSAELMQWDNLISVVINREFDEKKAQVFFEAHSGLLYTFANELIDFTLNYLEGK